LPKLSKIAENCDHNIDPWKNPACPFFSQPQKIREMVKAAAALERALFADLEPSLLKLAAVQVFKL
jgi:hypothetical protein